MTDNEILATAEQHGMTGARIEHPTERVVSLLIGEGGLTRGIDFNAEGLRAEHVRCAVTLFKGRVDGNG